MIDETRIAVLYVDDEPNNLDSFKATFRRLFKVYLANSAKEAEQILSKRTIHVLITDQKMPIKLGTELLEESVKKYPNQTRILLTAFDDATIRAAMHKNLIFKYILKPWNDLELKEAIEDGYEMFQLSEKRKKFAEALEYRNSQLGVALMKKNDGLDTGYLIS